MRVEVHGTLFNLYKKNDFENKDTKEKSEGKYQLQFIAERKLENGTQKIVQDVSIPESLVSRYKDKVGKEVSINVGVMSFNNKIMYYGLES